MGYVLKAGGREHEVQEARVGQILALRAFLSRQPRPPEVRINLDGLLDALTRGATENLPDGWAQQLGRSSVESHLREIRRSGRTIVQQHLKDVREEERYWPPDPQHPMGIHTLLHAEGGFEELALQMLRTSDPGVTKPEAADFVSNVAEIDFEAACAEFFGHNRRAAEIEAILAAAQARGDEEAGEPAEAEAEGGGGPGNGGAARKGGRPGRSTTRKSTPS